MHSKLSDYLTATLKHHGAISVHDYMDICLNHPNHGFYQAGKAIGASGSFITAPEISQIFGEILGLWVANIWQNMGHPEKFHLVEFGGGHGTLMKDMLRVQKHLPAMHAACHVHMVETSPNLSDKQAKTLEEYHFDRPIFWHKDCTTLPDDAPCIFVGNEFFDALPVHHIQYHDGAWYERQICLQDDGLLGFTLHDEPTKPPQNHLLIDDAKEGDIIEFSPLSMAIMHQICMRIQQQRGAAIFVDYGYAMPCFGESLQAVKNHQIMDIFDTPGECDLSAHVDFGALAHIVGQFDNLKLVPLISQGMFLSNLGIKERAEQLKQMLSNDAPKEEIDSAVHRLIHKDEMGELFKVFSFGSRNINIPFDAQDQLWQKGFQPNKEG